MPRKLRCLEICPSLCLSLSTRGNGGGRTEEISLASHSVLSAVKTLQLQSGSQSKLEFVFYALWGTKPEQRQTVDTSASLRKMEDLPDSVQFFMNIVIFP